MHPDPLSQITDQVGVRVITYVHSDVVATPSFHRLRPAHRPEDRDMGRDTARQGRFGYASRHLLPLSGTGAAASYDPMRCVSVQLRTVPARVGRVRARDPVQGDGPPEHAPDLDRRFTLAAGLLELADREFSVIRDTVSESMGGRGQRGR